MKKILLTMLVIAALRAADSLTTYIHTPDLTDEMNPFVMYLGVGWGFLIIKNVILVLVCGWCLHKSQRTFIPINSDSRFPKLEFKQFLGEWMFKNQNTSYWKMFLSFPRWSFIKKAFYDIFPSVVGVLSIMGILNNGIHCSAIHHPEISSSLSWFFNLSSVNFIWFMTALSGIALTGYVYIPYLKKTYTHYLYYNK